MTLKPLSLFIAAFFLIASSVALCFKTYDIDFASDREIIVMRNIGHKILLSSGDSLSRVLPVSKLNNNQYQIRFEGSFQFTPDSIVRIVRQAVEANNLPTDYLVNVIDCQKKQVVYGFGILKSEQTNLVACRGRKQPKGCYSVKITFRNTGMNRIDNSYWVGAGGSLVALLFIFSGLRINYRKKNSARSLVQSPLITSKVIPIGNYLFHSDKQCLEYQNEHIELSDKESKLLYILATKPNELIERGKLQKVWEDEGVIVGRSLDMFISKLRKKLENDPNVRIVNVHGKGYKLEVT